MVPVQAHAELVDLKMDNGRQVVAEYKQGNSDAPAILILHGFLQTREFYTVKRLYDALADSGYHVLAPSLSLGVDRRKKSLACEAIHDHSMETDVEEVAAWAQWLSGKTGKKIILIGHSAGSIQLAAYINEQPRKLVEQVVFISLGYFGKGPIAEESEADFIKASGLLKQGNKELNEFGLAYCKKYLTLPENYISYYRWDKERIFSALKNSKMNMTAIYGSKDERIEMSWVDKIKTSGLKVLTIEGANHFFDSEYEFDLQDAIEAILPEA